MYKKVESIRQCINILNIQIGNKYKHWTVADGPYTTDNSNRGYQWLCKCDCGNLKFFRGSDLLNPYKNFKCKECYTAEQLEYYASKKSRKDEISSERFNKIKSDAKSRGIKFYLTQEFLNNLYKKQNGICAITGEKLNSIDESSLDRIDSSVPYIESNVQWVTAQANKCKHVLSMNELYDFCKKVLNHANQQPSQEI